MSRTSSSEAGSKAAISSQIISAPARRLNPATPVPMAGTTSEPIAAVNAHWDRHRAHWGYTRMTEAGA